MRYELNHPLVRRAAWGWGDEAIARHEASHATAEIILHGGDRIESITIAPPATVRKVFGGRIRLSGSPSDEESVELATQPDEELDSGLRDPEEDDAWLIAGIGAGPYSGVAGQFPRASGIPLDAWTASLGDRRDLERSAARAGLRVPADFWCEVAWDAAKRLVDEHWGAVLWIAAGLLEHKTISGDQARALFAAAPELHNHRPVWR